MSTDYLIQSKTVDLSGLPDPVIRDIQRLIQTIREKVTVFEPLGNPGTTVGREARPTAGRDEDTLSLFLTRPKLSTEELSHLLDEFSSVPLGKTLPPDFSRTDIYDDHD